MKKMLMFLVANAVLVFSCDAGLVDITDKRSEYLSKLNEVRETLFGDSSIEVSCKARLAAVSAELSKEEGIDFQQVTSDVFDVLPEVSNSAGTHLLNKIAVFSVFHLLKSGVYNFVGASFYPEEEDLADIKIEGQPLTSSDFREIQETLQRRLETEGKLPRTSIAFENVVKTIVKRRPTSALEILHGQPRLKSADATLRAKATDNL
ncbi:MAG: hypothetical protein LBS23_00210 [Holosporaceae bacterium]|jgi:hypothetical protein|nr:hypothetical protein [Holosporaceae bacterium]